MRYPDISEEKKEGNMSENTKKFGPMHYAAKVAIREWKILKSKWLYFTNFSTKYYFLGFYWCENAYNLAEK